MKSVANLLQLLNPTSDYTKVARWRGPSAVYQNQNSFGWIDRGECPVRLFESPARAEPWMAMAFEDLHEKYFFVLYHHTKDRLLYPCGSSSKVLLSDRQMDRFLVKSKLPNPNISTMGTTPSMPSNLSSASIPRWRAVDLVATRKPPTMSTPPRWECRGGCCDCCPVLLARFNFFSTARGCCY